MTSARFEEDKAAIRTELEKRARASETITYGEAAALVGRANQGLGSILDAIKHEEAAASRPDLGCLVVDARTKLPSYVGAEQSAKDSALTLREAVFKAWRKAG